MQIIECDNCHSYFELPQDSFDRLDRARKTGSGSVYIKCPYCNDTTPLNRFTTIYTDSELLLKRTENTDMAIQYGLLPKEYEQYIQSMGVIVSINNEQYKLYSNKELFKIINIDGHNYPQIQQLQGYSKTLGELSEISSKEQDILNKALSIGEGAGCVLFVIHEDGKHKLYVFYTDGAYIKPLFQTLNSLINNNPITNSKTD